MSLRWFFILLVIPGLLTLTPLRATAQSAGGTVATGVSERGKQTLEDILARQKAALRGLKLAPGTAAAPAGAPAGPDTGPLGPRGNQSLSDIWNRWRGGDPLNLLKPYSADQVMTTSGEQWRLLRVEYIRRYAGWFPLGALVLLVAFWMYRGRIRIRAGRAGRKIARFTITQRVAHWFTAGVFILLALTGLLILLGRPLILPWLGHDAHSVLISAAMQAHNLFGPLFIAALIWLFIKFLPGNLFHPVDLGWILRLGGLFGGHVSAGRFNFGEKAWFWLLIIVGAVLSITGLAMEFPWLFADLRWLQLSTVLHAIGAIVLISVALGHIYIGSIGMEGAIDSMLEGEVDENWAREHHDLWYQEVTSTTGKEKEEASA